MNELMESGNALLASCEENSSQNGQAFRKSETSGKNPKKKKASLDDLNEQETINIKLPLLYIKALKMKAQLDEQTIGDIICAALTKPLSDDMELVKLRYARNNGIKLDV